MKTKSYIALCSLFIALLFAACGFGFDERPEERVAGFVPVETITGVPSGGQPYVSLPLAATVLPANATNKRIEWTVKTDGGTNSTLEGARLTAAAEGTLTVTATIADGLGGGVDYTQDFEILISLTGVYAVEEIYGIPEALPIGDFTYTLNGKITPNNASNRNIVWSVIADGGTGTTINGNYLAAQRKGTVRLLATIPNGSLTSDYTQEFSIVISRGVVAVGNDNPSGNTISDPYRACYWVDGEIIFLSGSGSGNSSANGIVYVGNKQFIAGRDNDPCYWVDGVQKRFPDSPDPAYSNSGIISIAAGGGYVYIIHSYSRQGSNDISCYSKIDADSGEIIHTAQLLNGAFEGLYSNIIAVKNDGSAVIAFGRYYWLSDETHSQSAINRNAISALSASMTVQCVGLVGGEVYFAGVDNTNDYFNRKPFYYRLSDNSLHVSPAAFAITVYSIFDQNGVPLFYGSGIFEGQMNYYGSIISWGTGWDFKDLKISGNQVDLNFRTQNAVYSDGDVYVALSYTHYMLLKEPYPSRRIDGTDIRYSATINKFVVIEDSMLGGATLPIGNVGGITAPVWTAGAAISLAPPPVNISGQTVTAQGWRISPDGNTHWTEFTASTADISHNGKYLRYYARSASSRTFYSNTVSITVGE